MSNVTALLFSSPFQHSILQVVLYLITLAWHAIIDHIPSALRSPVHVSAAASLTLLRLPLRMFSAFGNMIPTTPSRALGSLDRSLNFIISFFILPQRTHTWTTRLRCIIQHTESVIVCYSSGSLATSTEFYTSAPIIRHDTTSLLPTTTHEIKESITIYCHDVTVHRNASRMMSFTINASAGNLQEQYAVRDRRKVGNSCRVHREQAGRQFERAIDVGNT